ncbi:MAG: AIPR family protein [Alphaproteobacteria bacterium]|nr:AIPR family protein [Alphaproteobacteria bacterium]MBU1525066.1 AIPR family protein [Alphaproteobacteria bacterium]MBU2351348.1 AIPR family protein [Alphaproteobacteria bacterium]MBU2382876.1 AIPR family protein [Alphaproteobacteria bacterium]
MSVNDREVLVQLFNESKANDAPNQTDSDFFETYVPYHFLKGHEVDSTDIEAGIVDGSGDGGIDSVYALADGRLITEVDPATVRKNVDLHLWLFSTKYIDGFKLNTLDTILATTSDLLTLDDDLFNQKSGIYNQDVVAALQEFRAFYLAVAAKFPKLEIRVVFATKSASEASAPVKAKLAAVKSQLSALYSSAKVEVIAADAQAVLTAVSQAPEHVRGLAIAGNPISQQNGPSYVALAKLSSYSQFISKADGSLEAEFFDDNVRDYEGDVAVNTEIAATLDGGGPADFWWLNNGVSIICDEATLSGSMLQIVNPKVVNGLQTSRKIHEHFGKPGANQNDDRLLLVRVVSATDEDLRADIIASTNRQTPIQPGQLKTTSVLHKKLETYLRGQGLFYERRKNFWKNQGKKRADIVSVTEIAQAMVTVIGGRAHTARARPGGIMKSDPELVFNEQYSLGVYVKAIRLVRAIDDLIAQTLPAAGRRDRNNIKFQVVGRVVSESTGGNFAEKPFEGAKLIDTPRRQKIIGEVFAIYQSLGANDKVAKSEEFWTRARNDSF